MRYLCFVLWVILAAPVANGQHQFSISEEPVFRTPEDSLRFALAEKNLAAFFRDKPGDVSLDSLFAVRNHLLETAISGYKKIYRTSLASGLLSDSMKFVSLREVLQEKDRSKITRLAIDHRGLRKLPKEIFECKNLRYLELANTNLRNLNKLRKFPYLKSLYVLNSQALTHLKLGPLKNIEVFGMRGETANAVPTKFKGLINLKRLDLASCGLQTFPTGFATNKKLTEVQLAGNELTLTNDRIPVHPYLEKLELQKNKITEVPASIRQFPHLKRLLLNYNQVSVVSPEIDKLQQLEQVSFYHNRLTSVPEGLYSIRSLKELDLYFNEIERLDGRVSQWQNLKVLYLANNRLIGLPDEIGLLQSLDELYLHNNRISVLPETIGKLTDLKVLRINNNYLGEIPESLLSLHRIENLDLSKNSLTHLPSGLYKNTSLKLLILIDNPWTMESQDNLQEWAEKLRSQNAIVHFNPSAPSPN